MFYPGMLVECIINVNTWYTVRGNVAKPPYPVYKHVYTVTGAGTESVHGPSITLAELPGQDGYWAKAFRPIQDEKLSVFRALLAPKPKQLEQV